MNLKGICILAIGMLAAIPAPALEERVKLFPGSSSANPAVQADSASSARTIGEWLVDGATLRKGFKGGMDYVIADQAYAAEPSTDLLLHFDSVSGADETGNWDSGAGRAFAIDSSKALLGTGAGSFRGPDSALSLRPRAGSIFGAARGGGQGSGFRDFSIEFWLFPANAENGEVVLLWRSLRKLPSGVVTQNLSCVVAGGRLSWSFSGFFSPPGTPKAADAAGRIELRARAPLVPRAWSHHLLRFDGDTGLVEYLVDGRSEAVAYATASGREGGTVFEPVAGAAAPLELCPDYSGLVDELRISRRQVEEPSLRPFGRGGSLVVSPVADLGYGNSRLVAVESEYKAPGTASVEFSYRIGDSWAGWRSDSPAWLPFRAGEPLPASARGRYAQVKAELFADGTGRLTPSLSSLTFRYEPDPPPPAPGRIVATPKDGAVELRWTRVPEADLAGYLVYYGERPGEYFGTGADQGPSPVDAGDTTTLTLTGIPNGRLLYFVVAAYDAAAGRAESRAGEFSPETAARPSRTAK
jgi:hypothetical protein